MISELKDDEGFWFASRIFKVRVSRSHFVLTKIPVFYFLRHEKGAETCPICDTIYLFFQRYPVSRAVMPEFGIRKVLGAPIGNIIRLISTEFMVIIGVSSLLAVPFTITFMSNWLEGFAYRIDLVAYWPIYLISGLILGVITWVTVGIMTYRSAILNPLESIKRD